MEEVMMGHPEVKCGWGMDFAWAHLLRKKDIGVVDA